MFATDAVVLISLLFHISWALTAPAGPPVQTRPRQLGSVLSEIKSRYLDNYQPRLAMANILSVRTVLAGAAVGKLI